MKVYNQFRSRSSLDLGRSVVYTHYSKIFSSETAWPMKAKFYVEPPWAEGTKVCSRDLGHMTKMAATPIYGKKVQVGKDQEKAQSEKDSHSKNRGGKKPN